ncbi:MAG: hypothetical protein ACOX05_02055 [Bacillota bacterium]|jgi:hypothetical protein
MGRWGKDGEKGGSSERREEVGEFVGGVRWWVLLSYLGANLIQR